MDLVSKSAGNPSPYDIRQYTYEPGPPVSKYLNQKATQSAIFASNSPNYWRSCGAQPGLGDDIPKSLKPLMADLIANYRVLVYNGQFDLICNLIGTEKYLDTLEWPGRFCFTAQYA